MSDIVAAFEKQVAIYPQKLALIFPRGKKTESITFRQFHERSLGLSAHFQGLGLLKGDKVVILVRPSLDFAPMVLALLRIGVVAVFIDPGMGRKNLLRAITSISPRGLIGEQMVHFLRLFYPGAFKSVKVFVNVGPFNWGKMKRLSTLSRRLKVFPLTATHNVLLKGEDLAAILFTSGGTGIPKGVEYKHKTFFLQGMALKKMFGLGQTDLDLPGLPLFSLFTLSMGMTSCLPEMNPAKPAKACGKKLFKNITDHQITFVAGSPAIWEKLANYCLREKKILPSVKFVVMFGAPVPLELLEKYAKILPNGTTYTPYGATESLPMTNVSGRFLLEYARKKTSEGLGTCVGRPILNVAIKIIKMQDGPLSTYTEMPQGEVGEIIVKSEMVTQRYFEMPEKTKEAKIYEDGGLWHRMGDIGYFDQLGHLWFLGRKTHLVNQLSSVACEEIFNQHPAVKKTALIGPIKGGKVVPELFVERIDKKVLTGHRLQTFEKELRQLGEQYPHTQGIETFYLKKHFPVDVRHNIKIDRLKLKDEVERKQCQ